MAFESYWNLVEMQLTMRVLLVAMPAAYGGVTLLYMYLRSQDTEAASQPITMRGRPPPGAENNPYMSGDAGSSSRRHSEEEDERATNQAINRWRIRAPIDLKFYHFLPLWRYFLVVKSLQADDIEGVFMVNSLSSFTLGSAQIAGIIFTLLEMDTLAWDNINFFIKLNMFSAIMNWSITILYFMTQVSNRMKNAILVESMTYNLTERFRQDIFSILTLADKDASEFARSQSHMHAGHSDSDDDAGSRRMAKFRHQLEKEIELHKQTTIDLAEFIPKELVLIKKALYRQYAADLAKV